MGSHQSTRMKSEDWLTPPKIITALGPFDLDPCTPEKMPWKTAERRYTIKENGLWMPWHGRVWLNPPYGRETIKWVSKLSDHGNGIALVFARTETNLFFRFVWPEASALLFLKGRLHFYGIDGLKAKHNGGAPTVLIAYGSQNAKALEFCNIKGAFVRLK